MKSFKRSTVKQNSVIKIKSFNKIDLPSGTIHVGVFGKGEIQEFNVSTSEINNYGDFTSIRLCIISIVKNNK